MTVSWAVRRARPSDAAQVAAFLRAIWPATTATEETAQRGLACRRARVNLAEAEGRIVGLVAAFPTSDGRGRLRWEIDLLAVAAAWRRRGLATRLLRTTLVAGAAAGAVTARALVAARNKGAAGCFQTAGLAPAAPALTLLTRPAQPRSEYPGCLLPVTTLTYAGWWLELDGQTSRTPAYGPRQAVIGVLVDDARAAEAWPGWARHGRYHWWACAYPTSLDAL